MSDRTTIYPSYVDSTQDMSPGTYLKHPEWGVFVCCSGCGVALQLDHDIDDDGSVSPSVVCPLGGCDFHEHIRLEGWSA